jgi:hypothetical protein
VVQEGNAAENSRLLALGIMAYRPGYISLDHLLGKLMVLPGRQCLGNSIYQFSGQRQT